MTRKSWKSSWRPACSPPLIMLTIGIGSGLGVGPPARWRHSGTPARRGLGARDGQRDGEDRVGAEPRLVRRAVELDQACGRPPRWSGVASSQRRGDLAVRPPRRRAARRVRRSASGSPSRRSTASWRPVDAPDGTLARAVVAVVELELGLDGRAPARVEHLAAPNARDHALLRRLASATAVCSARRRARRRLCGQADSSRLTYRIRVLLSCTADPTSPGAQGLLEHESTLDC